MENSVKLLLKKNISDFWIDLEKYWNTGSPSGYGIDLADPYNPKSCPGYFLVPVYEVPWDKATRIGDYPNGFPSPTRPDVEYIPVHPLALDEKFSELEPTFHLKCTATSSGRTLALLQNNSVCSFLKLHFPGCLGRFNRDIPLYSWVASLSISAELQSTGNNIPDNTAFLIESGGVYIESDFNFGSIFRASDPFPKRKYFRILPAFSLIMAGPERDYSIELLRTIFSQNIKLEQFVELALKPIIDSYFWLSLKRGLIPECNAQNVLFCLDSLPIEKAWTVVFRDFADFFVDFEMRKENNLHNNFARYKNIGGWAIEKDLYERRSFAFDYKLSQYLLRPLIEVASRAYGWKETELQKNVKSIVENIIPIKDYFSSDKYWFKYPNTKGVSRKNYQKMVGGLAFR